MAANGIIQHAGIAVILLLLIGHHSTNAFSSSSSLSSRTSTIRTTATAKTTRTELYSSSTSTVQPSESSTIGTVGSGYLPILLSKLAAHRQHGKSWIICPTADMDKMAQLSSIDGFGTPQPNLELVPASDTDRVEELLAETDALMIGTDDVESVVDPSILNYLMDPEKVKNLKRVVAMSRNLNGSGMGMFVSASRKAANAQVWDNSSAEAYRQYEANVQSAAQNCGADWTIVRAGTLKGGACGETNANAENADEAAAKNYPQYLHQSFYEMTKNDIITWQLLFDCNVRGVKLARGDVMSGPGFKAVFAATGSDEHEGDSGRCGVAEAMLRSLEVERAANVDFGVGTVASREVPSEEEWESLFRECLS
eukprot:CAMPEP_0196130810 /NCGR_PEP_ID=MMETSP0910-20130528/1059_1 /TAXON_ID=49265 /ORGANISM="Thalassiosira rotula, Strain GSO102" /LENGTH=366 /DNA_ID=CAMNT_0041390187 /DNA_START=151 /DNA_END=1251 /DNA_ORIENTATION=-